MPTCSQNTHFPFWSFVSYLFNTLVWSTNANDVYTCKWLKNQTNHFKHFTIILYEGELVGDDSFIHQPLTHNTCYYRNFSCSPSEIPTSQIVCLPSNHSFQRFRDLGLYDIQQLSDFILIPKLNFGGAIQNTRNRGLLFQLDNGFLVVRCKPTPSAFSLFLALATKFLSNARPTLQSGLLEAHLTLTLENQRSKMISLWDQFCMTRNRLIQIQHWMIRYFPESSAMWVTDSPGYHVEISRDAILLSKCHIITSYKVFWNRSISYKCFREIPVQLLPSKTVKFLQFNQRKLISQGTPISCDARPNSTFFEDQNSILGIYPVMAIYPFSIPHHYLLLCIFSILHFPNSVD